MTDKLHDLARDEALPNGQAVRVLDEAAQRRLASSAALSLRQVQLKALKAGIIPRRYLRNFFHYTPDDQSRLLESRVAQVGLGGLGGHILDILARMGVGRIRAADGDTFDEHNLNRQLLSTLTTVGFSKALAAMERVRAVNPAVELEAHQEFLTAASLGGFLEGCSVAVDALGGLADREALQKAAAAADIPLVTGAMAGLTGYVAVVRPGMPGPASFMGQSSAAENALGTPPASVNVVASIMAQEVIRLLLSGSSPLENGMLLIDLQSLSFETVRF